MNKEDTFLEKKARTVRATCVQMAYDGKEGHLSSALSCVDILIALYNGFLHVDASKPKDINRDRFFFSKGHACTALYAVLADRGFVPVEWLQSYAKTDSPFPNHPCIHALPVLEASSGSLGHGLGLATGSMYGLRLDKIDTRAVVLMSDGECNEGSVWESAMFAAAQNMDRLLAIVDYNGVQAVGRSDEIMGYTSLEAKFKAFGWAGTTINGLSISEIRGALAKFPFAKNKPSFIIAKTRAGAGISFMEDDQVWHYRKPSDDDLKRALSELGEKPMYLRQVEQNEKSV
ncbi:MAG: transketolase [Kiritimatiellae bacterium]|nr:transketolase [Kiritimatiellia bacterium]MDD5521308.1 transketolase [Kiritimatiellia bacterium]